MNSRQIKRDFYLAVCVVELPERFELLGTEWIPSKRQKLGYLLNKINLSSCTVVFFVVFLVLRPT